MKVKARRPDMVVLELVRKHGWVKPGPLLVFLLAGVLLTACHGRRSSNAEMTALLHAIRDSEFVPQNTFYPEAQVPFYDSISLAASDERQRSIAMTLKADALIKSGREQQALGALTGLLQSTDMPAARRMILKMMAIAWMRIGERTNCINNHTVESCVFPIRGSGIQTNRTGSSRAIELYEYLLKEDSTDLESRWLLNIAYMTIGEYPSRVPAAWLLKGLDGDTIGSI